MFKDEIYKFSSFDLDKSGKKCKKKSAADT